MGWVWRGEEDDSSRSSAHDGGGRWSTRKVLRSQCKTEEVESGKFIRKCEKTEEVFRDCLGEPTQVVESNKEYTEEDVTEQVRNGRFSGGSSEKEGLFEFPGLQSDIEAIERQLFSGISRFFDAAEDMKNGLLGAFGGFNGSEVWSTFPDRRQGAGARSHPLTESPSKGESGFVDLSGMARDV